MDIGVLLEWIFLSFNSFNIEIIVLLDWISLLFISFVILISSMIILYRYIYIYEEKFFYRFIYLVILFVLSIIFIILSPNVIRILFGWDGLGLVSYCLVIYYQNYISYNSGIVTVLCNRIGDVGLLIGIGLILINGRWNLWMLEGRGKIVIFILFLAAITKRAQLPFSVWLPMAIAAPTPVSALVHSSTLVTAGVYLIIRFNKFLIDRGLNVILFFLSVLTIFIAGFMANLENDLKKIIALSTLRQLGLIIIILRVGFRIVAFYHLLTHAIFKSMIFICAGIIIHAMMNNQDIRLLGNLNDVIPFVIIRFFISNLALCGFPFLAGFYSKDYIVELIYINQINVLIALLVILSFLFTVTYSVRLFYYIFFRELKFYRYYRFRENNLINFSIIILIVLRVVIGSVLSWIFFFDFYLIFLKVRIKTLIIYVRIGGVFMGLICGIKNFLRKYYYLNFYFGSIWFLGYLYQWVYNPFNFLGLYFYELDKTWLEFKIKNLFGYLLKFFQKKILFNMYIFMIIFIYVLLLVFIMH